jgi:hypothetical protein
MRSMAGQRYVAHTNVENLSALVEFQTVGG